MVEERVFIVDMKEKSKGERERILGMASRLNVARRGEEKEKGNTRGDKEERASQGSQERETKESARRAPGRGDWVI